MVFNTRRGLNKISELSIKKPKINDPISINAYPQHFRLENMSDNRSHEFEMEGNDIPKKLRIEMTDFVNKQRGEKK